MVIGKFKLIAFGLVAFTISLSAIASVYGQSESFYKGKSFASSSALLLEASTIVGHDSSSGIAPDIYQDSQSSSFRICPAQAP